MCLERLQGHLLGLDEITKALSLPIELPDLLNIIMNKISSVIDPAQRGTILLWDHAEGAFHPAASFGYRPQALKELVSRVDESITENLFKQGDGKPFQTSEDVDEGISKLYSGSRAVAARTLVSPELNPCTLTAPISLGDQKYGVLIVETISDSDAYFEINLSLLYTIADLIALAIKHDRLAIQSDATRLSHQIERMRAELLATLSHELRIPLTTIQGYASALLLDEVEWSDEKRQQFLTQIETECQNMEGLLRDILDSSLEDIDQLTIDRQPVRLRVIARAAATENQLRTDKHTILVDFPGDFPVLDADPRWIKQVFCNILENAIKYSPRGGLIVIRGEIRKNSVLVYIADQGIGISPEDQSFLFERYFRVRSLTHLNIPGSGLGLPISKTIIEAHGGRIWVDSKLEEGTTVYFTLPRPK